MALKQCSFMAPSLTVFCATLMGRRAQFPHTRLQLDGTMAALGCGLQPGAQGWLSAPSLDKRALTPVLK